MSDIKDTKYLYVLGKGCGDMQEATANESKHSSAVERAQ